MHNINGNSMMYVGEKPWHGIGTELKKPATAKEAIMAAKLNYEVGTEHLKLANTGTVISPELAIVRMDTKDKLGIVTKKYKIIQNVEAFDFFDNVVGEGKAIYHTAGALGLGERIWTLAKLPKDLVIKKEVVEQYLLLTNSHDGKSSLKMYFTPVRVVCQNTLMMSLRDASSGISIRHTGNIKSKVEEAQRVLDIATVFYSDFEKIAEKFVATKMDVKKTEDYFDQVLDIKENDDDNYTRVTNQKADLLSIYENGKGNDRPEVRHTLWTAFNAVTEYTDHFRTIKNVEKDKSLKLDSIWFGSGAKMKVKAYDIGLSFAGISKN